VGSKSPKKEKVGYYDFEAVDPIYIPGIMITNRNTISEEIQRRITAENKCYYGLQKQLKSKQLKRKIKLTTYKTMIRPVLLYGSQTWTLTKTDENKLRTFENKALRKTHGPLYDG
jgi:hypothetical protein